MLSSQYLNKIDIYNSIVRENFRVHNDDYIDHALIYNMNFEEFKNKLNDGLIDLQKKNKNGYNLIHIMTLMYKFFLFKEKDNRQFNLKSNYCEKFQYLIEKKVDINIRSNTRYGDNILYIFFHNNVCNIVNYDLYADFIGFLLENNADPNQKTLIEPYLSPFQYLALKTYDMYFHSSNMFGHLFRFLLDFVKYGADIYDTFNIKRVTAIYQIHRGGYCKFVTTDESINVLTLFDDFTDLSIKNEIFLEYKRYVYGKHKSFLEICNQFNNDGKEDYGNNNDDENDDGINKNKKSMITSLFNNQNMINEILEYIA